MRGLRRKRDGEKELQEWLERFAERLKGRTNAVADQVQQVVDQMGAVELNLQNTFNSLRILSSSQFVENRVYEEDETEVVSAETPKRDARKPSMPTESYEDEILPRYKDALATAWQAFQRGPYQPDQSSERATSPIKKSTSYQDERIQILPHVIGTDEFTRDIHCGLADIRKRHHVVDDSKFAQDVERSDLAAELIGSDILSEGEISGSESDGSEFQEGGLEPAVSAALDFKAMLEAALRNPSLPYDGGTLNDSDNVYGEFNDDRFTLPYMANDNSSNSPRTISTMVDIIGRTISTMAENTEELRNSTSEESNAPKLPPTSHWLPEVSIRSTGVESAAPSRSLQPDEDDLTYPEMMEERLKRPFGSQTQDMLNEEFKQYIESSSGNRQARRSSLGHIPSISGGLFDDEESDSGLLPTENAALPNSNTGPTIPEGMFQKQPAMDGTHTRTESQDSSSVDSSQVILRSQPSLMNTVIGPSNQDSDSTFTDLGSKGSDKHQLTTTSSPMSKHASLHSASSSISSSLNAIIGSQQAGPLAIRGLFDDDDDEEDEDDLFGASAPRVESQPVLRPWASRSSKGLFDDFEDTQHTEQVAPISDEARSSHEMQPNSGISSLPGSQQHKDQSRYGALDSQRRLADSFSAKISPGSARLDLVTSRDQKEIESESQNEYSHEVQPSSGISSLPGSQPKDQSRFVDLDSQRQLADGVSAKTSPGSALLDLVTSIDPKEIEPESQNDEGRENIPLPIQSMLKAAVRSSVPLAVDSDEDSWSRSESEDGSVVGEKAVPEQSTTTRDSGPELIDPDVSGANASQDKMAEGISNLKPALLVDSVHLALSLSSSENTSPVAISPDKGDDRDSSSEKADELPPVFFTPGKSRSLLDTEVSPVKVAIKLDDSPLMHSKPLDLPDVDESDPDSDVSSRQSQQSERFGQPQPVQNVMPRILDPAEHLAHSSSQPIRLPASNSVEAKNLIPEDVSKSSSTDLPLPVNDFGRLTARRAFTPLFEDDDAEDDLFGPRSPKHQGSLFPGAGQRRGGLSSDTMLAAGPSGQHRASESEPRLMTQDASPELPQVLDPSTNRSLATPPAPAEPAEGDQSSTTKPVSKLSSLLFGDDDEDNEDALFGPLGGRASRGSNGLKSGKAVSLFADDNLPSSSTSHPKMRGRSLFDD